MSITTPSRRSVGGLVAVALVAALGVLAVPQTASAQTYDIFEIENFSVDDFTLKSATQPANNGWGPPPPASVNRGERRNFGIASVPGSYDQATLVYTLPFLSQTYEMRLTTDRSPWGDFSTCWINPRALLTCTVVKSVGGANTKFIIGDKYDSERIYSSEIQPYFWAETLNSLCMGSSLATCVGPARDPNDQFGNWRVTFGKNTFDFDYIQWAGTNGAFASGTRGNPYQQVVGTPKVMRDEFGFQTLVSGLPPGLAYYPQSDQIMGTLSAVPGKYTVTIKLVNGTGITTLSIGTRTITILAVPTIVTTSLGSVPVGSQVVKQLFIDTGGPLSATTITVKGLPNGLAYKPASLTITGTPTTAGTYPLTITATNGAGTATKTVPLVVKPKP